MQSVFENGGMIGLLMDYNDNITRYQLPNTIPQLTFVGGFSVGILGRTSDYSLPLTSLTGGTDSSPQTGDIVIVVAELTGIVDKTYNISGYTQIADLYANSTSDSNLFIGYKVMGAVPDTSVTITGGTTNLSDAGAFAVHVWRNFDTSSPFDVAAITNTQTTTATPNPPAITPVTNNAVILVAAGSAHIRGEISYTASYLSNFKTVGGTDDDRDATVGIGSVNWTSGTYDPAAWSFGAADATTYSTNSVTMALRPAPQTENFGNYKNSGIWNMKAVYDSFLAGVFLGYSYANNSGGSTIAVNVPTYVKNGDLLLAITFDRDGNTHAQQTGFTLIKNFVIANAGGSVQYRIANNEPASYTFTFNGRKAAAILVFRGLTFDTSSTAWTTSAGTTLASASAITTTSSKILLNITGGRNTSVTNLDAPIGFTNIVDEIGSSGTNTFPFMIVGLKKWVSGNTGTSTAQYVGTPDDNGAIHVSLK